MNTQDIVILIGLFIFFSVGFWPFFPMMRMNPSKKEKKQDEPSQRDRWVRTGREMYYMDLKDNAQGPDAYQGTEGNRANPIKDQVPSSKMDNPLKDQTSSSKGYDPMTHTMRTASQAWVALENYPNVFVPAQFQDQGQVQGQDQGQEQVQNHLDIMEIVFRGQGQVQGQGQGPGKILANEIKTKQEFKISRYQLLKIN